MYNTDLPTRADLPTSAMLWRSTIIAVVVAVAILATVVLPSEYGIDPTGTGRVLGLTQMGEIKMQLAKEAAADRDAAERSVQITLSNPGAPAPEAENMGIHDRLNEIERRLDDIAIILSTVTGRFSDTAPVPDSEPQAETALAVPAPSLETEPEEPAFAWQDEVSYTLQPGEGIEFKLVMKEGAEAEFEWTANGAVLNFDTHGDGSGNSISYEKGRGVPEQSGVIRAAFTGNHGWFWRNRTDSPVTLTLRTRGAYSELKRTV